MKREDIKRYQEGEDLLSSIRELEEGVEKTDQFHKVIDCDIHKNKMLSTISLRIVVSTGQEFCAYITPRIAKQIFEFYEEKVKEEVKQLEEEFEAL